MEPTLSISWSLRPRRIAPHMHAASQHDERVKIDPERALGRRKEAVSARLWRLPKQATPKRRRDSPSQSL